MTTPAQARRLVAHGEDRTIAEWARLLGMSRMTIYTRLDRGDTPEEALRPSSSNGRPRIEQPTAEERIHEATGLPVKEIREALRGGRTEAEMIEAAGRRRAG